MPESTVRVVGSGFSVLRWRGAKIAFLESVTDSGQSPVANVEPIQPLDEPYVLEFAIPRALGAGQLDMTIKELWSGPVWQTLAGLATANDLLDVWRAISALPDAITCVTVIKPPGAPFWRTKTYHGVVVNNIDDTESISIATMSVARKISCMYTYATRGVVTAGATVF